MVTDGDAHAADTTQAARDRIGGRTLLLAAGVAIAVIVTMLAASGGEKPGGLPGPSEPSTPAPHAVQFGVWGTKAEIAAYQRVVDSWNAMSEETDVTLLDWPTADAMMKAIRAGSASPEVYLLRRSDLAETVAAGRNSPLLDLLDARGVSLGDDYTRNAIAAFSAHDDLQCMPYTSSPMVTYYNTDLIDFTALEEAGQPVPREEDGRWSLDAFRAAAEAATRPRQHTRGFSIDPTLEGLAPFIDSGGGRLFNDDQAPTSLALGDDDSVDSLTRALEVLRDSTLSLTRAQLRQKSAVQWFEEGRVGMIAGYRDLVPRFRHTKGLHFDVLPMPITGTQATVGRLTGLCIAQGSSQMVSRAADFLVHAASGESVTEIVSTGMVAPTSLPVAFSDDFLEPDRQPARASVFTATQRYLRLWPLLDSWDELERTAAPGLQELLTAQLLTPDEIQEILDGIDERSRSILDPSYDPSESPSSPGSADPSGSAGSDASS